MKLRKEIEPRLDVAERDYPQVLKAILDYTAFCDEHGDEELRECQKLETHLLQLTGKDMSWYNLSEWWEEEGAEPLAFKISLPDPVVVDEISKAELREIITRLKTLEAPLDNEESFYGQFQYFLEGYYHQFLALNFKTYAIDRFQRKKDKSGNYFEYSIEEITEKIWNKI